MKQEELFKTLIKELLQMDTIHHEYIDNDTTYVIDSLKNGNELNIKVSIKENKDKKNFEKWLEQIDDTLFSEVIEELSNENELLDLNAIYASKDYKQVINKVKSKTKEVAQRKIKELQKLLS